MSEPVSPDDLAPVARTFAPLFAHGDVNRWCVVGSEGTVTYRELHQRAAILAGQLGLGPGPAILCGAKQPSMVIAILAALWSGRSYLPVDPAAPAGRLARIVAIARPTVAVAAQAFPPSVAAELRSRGVPIVELDPLGEILDGGPKTSDRPPRADLDPAYILFTSGTTGDPKGVVVPSEGLAHFLHWLLPAHNFTSDDVFLNQVPYTFDVSIVGLFGALLTGGGIFSLSPAEIANPRAMFSRLAGAPLTVWVSTPSLIRLVAAEPRFTQAMLPRLRLFWLAGEPLAPALVRDLQRRFPNAEIWNAYGPTEATVVVTATKVTADMTASDLPLPIGRALPGTDVWVGDPGAPVRRLADGETGELIIAGRQVALGYLNPEDPGQILPAAPDGRFFKLGDGRRAFRTGDLGYRSPNGWFYCLGRRDRQIKLHGFRVELEEVEAALRDVDGIADAAVFAVEHEGQPEYLVAVIVPGGPGAELLPETDLDLSLHVRAALRDRLPSYVLPRRYHLVREPPIGSSGKLDRRALEDAFR
jgi:D-alanine--poly(phosphoribitol) ligase subunit 1